jgi:hypothetical protein
MKNGRPTEQLGVETNNNIQRKRRPINRSRRPDSEADGKWGMKGTYIS